MMITITIPIFIFVSILIYLTSKGPIFYWSKRFGIKNKLFSMPKFRTMYCNTPDVATHLLKDPDSKVTRIGFFLRKLSIDELPQLISICKGNMNFIGPRPALHNQYDLINLRTKFNIHNQKPGITGWAQVNGRDNLSIEDKVNFEKYYLEKKSFLFDVKIILLTIIKIFKNDNISH